MSADTEKLIERLHERALLSGGDSQLDRGIKALCNEAADRIASLEAALAEARAATIAECVAALLAEAGRIKAIPWADRFNLKAVAHGHDQAANLLAALSSSKQKDGGDAPTNTGEKP